VLTETDRVLLANIQRDMVSLATMDYSDQLINLPSQPTPQILKPCNTSYPTQPTDMGFYKAFSPQNLIQDLLRDHPYTKPDPEYPDNRLQFLAQDYAR
jgi:hypothetical protein